MATGTTVRISNIIPTLSPSSLTSETARNDLLLDMAPYLRSYPKVKVTVDGKALDPDAVIEYDTEYDVVVELKKGMAIATLRIIEWSFSVERRLLFCTPDGFARHEELAGIQAKGFDFTAYVMSVAIADMSESDLSVGDLDYRIRAIGRPREKSSASISRLGRLRSWPPSSSCGKSKGATRTKASDDPDRRG